MLKCFLLLLKRIAMSESKTIKTKLKFDSSKVSSGILKRYLLNVLKSFDISCLTQDAPEQYMKDSESHTTYKVLCDLALMSVTDWKNFIKNNEENLENLFLQDDQIVTDSKYYYNSFQIVQEEVFSHETQVYFFKFVSEIVAELSSRSVVDIDITGNQKSLETDHFSISRNYSLKSQQDQSVIDFNQKTQMEKYDETESNNYNLFDD